MLVVEHGNRPVIFITDSRDLLEERVAWVLALAELVVGIVAMLADEKNRVDGKLVSPGPQSLGNGGIDGEAELLGTVSAQIVLGDWST